MPERELRTEILRIDPEHIDMEKLSLAGKVIRGGGLVAFPTETVYGLGGDALSPLSSKKIYAAKGRPSDNPLIVHIADMEHLLCIAEEIPETALKTADAFWPGPLTMILKKTELVPHETTGGLDTVAVRMPVDAVAAELIRISGGYIAAPSANTSGRPSPTSAAHVIEDLSGKIDMILDAGDADIDRCPDEVAGRLGQGNDSGFVEVRVAEGHEETIHDDLVSLRTGPSRSGKFYQGSYEGIHCGRKLLGLSANSDLGASCGGAGLFTLSAKHLCLTPDIKLILTIK